MLTPRKLTPTGDSSEPAMQLRMLIAFVLMGLVLFATPYFYKLIAPPAPPKPVVVANSKPAESAAVVNPALASVAPAVPSAPVAGQTVADTAIDTALYHIVFSNKGAVVKSWTLKEYKDRVGKPLEVVNSEAAQKTGYPFSFDFRNRNLGVDLNQAVYAVESAGSLGVTFRFSDGRVSARKSFEFQQHGYLTQVTTSVTQNGSPVPHLLEWRGGFGDLAVQNAPGQGSALHYDLSDSKLVKKNAKSAKDHPVNADGSYSFAGLEDQYFAAVFLPESNGSVQTTTFDDQVPTPFDKSEQPFVGVAVGGESVNKFSLFVGPKDLDTLKKLNPKLVQLIDFGFFSIVAKPLFLILHWLNDQFVHNYGWSIVVITVVINILLFPLRFTNMKSMKKMQALQPQIQAINEKYKNLPLRDPRQAKKNEETMELYKKHGANPLGGCIPLLIQLPFLWAFYKVLAVSLEMRNASWLWVNDLSQPEHLAIRVLPVLMILTGFIMQRMTPTAGVDPSQQRMMAFMPLMMGFFFYGQSSGLVLYWLTGNLVGIVQQLFFNKTLTPVVAIPPPRDSGKKNQRK